MEKKSFNQQSRRAFLRNTLLAGSALYLLPGRLFALHNFPVESNSSLAPDFSYKYRTFSVDHLKEVMEWMEKLKKDGKITINETVRKYIGGFNYDPEKILPGAKSAIIIAIPQNIISITFRKDGKAYEIKSPTGYFDDKISGDAVKERVMKEIIKDPTKKLQGKIRLPLKTLAVRSGLAEYGKNNITFVGGGYGSFHRLTILYTDKELPDSWGPLKTMQLCKGCSICTKSCPTKCITEQNFVIDAGKCITLYNELPDPMPAWIDSKAHNALVGCFKCQDICPANKEANKRVENLATLNEKETELILNLGKDKAIQDSVLKKLDRFLTSAEDIPYLSRNLKLIMANTKPLTI